MLVRTREWLRWTPMYGGVGVFAILLGMLLARGHIYLAIAGVLGAALAVVLGMQALGVRAIYWWLTLGLVAYPFVRYPTGHSQLTFDRVWILGLGGALLITAAGRTYRTPASRALSVCVGLFALALLARGLLTTPSRSYAIGLAVDDGVLPAILFFAARRMITDRERWDRFLLSFAVAGALLGAIGTAERLLGFQLATLSGGTVTVGTDVGVRVSGPYASDDVLAVALLMCLAASLVWIQVDVRGRLIRGSLVVALELAGLTFTFFRGAWIGALVVIVVGLGLRPRRYARLVGTLALVAALAGVLLLRAEDTRGLEARLSNTQNTNGRLATFQQAFELFKLHPDYGVGLGQFQNAQQADLQSTEVAGVEAVPTAHDSYLDLLAEGGLELTIPFLALTVAVVVLIHSFRRVARDDDFDVLLAAMIVGAGLAYFLMSLEETVIISSTESNAFFALLLGACAARLDQLRQPANWISRDLDGEPHE